MKKHKSIVSLLLVTAIILGNITGTVPVHAEKNIGTEIFDNFFKKVFSALNLLFKTLKCFSLYNTSQIQDIKKRG